MSGRTVQLPPNSYEIFAKVYDSARFARFALSQVDKVTEIARQSGNPLACGIGLFILGQNDQAVEKLQKNATFCHFFAFSINLAVQLLKSTITFLTQAFVVGVALSISAIAVAAKVFMDFDLLHHSIGRVVISAAVIDDIIGLVLLGVVTSMIATGSFPNITDMGYMIGKVVLFFGLTWLLGHRLSTHFWRMLHRVHMPGMRLMALLAIALMYGLFAEALGLHFILGPFMAGLYFEPKSVGHKAYKSIDHTIYNGNPKRLIAEVNRYKKMGKEHGG